MNEFHRSVQAFAEEVRADMEDKGLRRLARFDWLTPDNIAKPSQYFRHVMLGDLSPIARPIHIAVRILLADRHRWDWLLAGSQRLSKHQLWSPIEMSRLANIAQAVALNRSTEGPLRELHADLVEEVKSSDFDADKEHRVQFQYEFDSLDIMALTILDDVDRALESLENLSFTNAARLFVDAAVKSGKLLAEEHSDVSMDGLIEVSQWATHRQRSTDGGAKSEQRKESLWAHVQELALPHILNLATPCTVNHAADNTLESVNMDLLKSYVASKNGATAERPPWLQPKISRTTYVKILGELRAKRPDLLNVPGNHQPPSG